MKKLLVFVFLLVSSAANAWTIGDIVYLKSGSPALTVTEVLPNTTVGIHWFSGSAMMAATLPENTLTAEIPNPKIAHNEAIIAARDNPSPP